MKEVSLYCQKHPRKNEVLTYTRLLNEFHRDCYRAWAFPTSSLNLSLIAPL